jgi:protein farnesyltransferase/geranylgeranyltransferase type-1 subunit alpha
VILRRYVKENISVAPNNASAWNYLRGVLDHNHLPYSSMLTFVTPYTVVADDDATTVADLDNPLPSKGADLPCAAAIEFLADIYESEGGSSTPEAVIVRVTLFKCSLPYHASLALDVPRQ